jgi:hypothetical protein
VKEWAAAVALIVAAGCNAAPPPRQAGSDEAEARRLESLCKLREGTLRLIGDKQVTLQPPQDTPYERVDCLLRELSNSKLRSRDLGFVGNEAFSTEQPKKN